MTKKFSELTAATSLTVADILAVSQSGVSKQATVAQLAATIPSGLPATDTTSLVSDPADATKLMRIDVGAVSTGTIRVLSMGDRDVDLAAGGTFAELSHNHDSDYLQISSNLSDLGSASTARTNLGLGSSDSPQFSTIELGHASDTTLARSGSGAVTIEGNRILTTADEGAGNGLDADTLDGAEGAAYALLATLASTANGNGAALIGIEDSGGLITATTVEAALAEIAAYTAANILTSDVGGGSVVDGSSINVVLAALETLIAAVEPGTYTPRNVDTLRYDFPTAFENVYYSTSSDGLIILGSGIENDKDLILKAVSGVGDFVFMCSAGFTLNGASTVGVSTTASASFGSSSGADTVLGYAGADGPSVSAGDFFRVPSHSVAANTGYFVATGAPTNSSIPATKLANLDGSALTNPSDETAESITTEEPVRFSGGALDGLYHKLVSRCYIRRHGIDLELTGGTNAPDSQDGSPITDVAGISFGDTNGTIDKGAFRQAADQSSGSGTVTLDYDNGDLFQVTATGNITIALDNLPTGVAGVIILKAINFGAHTITWPTDLWPGGSPPTLTTSGTDHIVIMWEDDGTLSFSVRGLDMS